MKIYNTLSKKADEFRPLGGVVGIYSCGPTVYNHAHIGNLSAYVYADLLRRVLNLAGYKTEHVMNITDVDDKMI
ncbi:MAG: cysteine--tRNA ligase, partial [Candidatus Nomurabacteria bacterium]|nr:cysteine--tRNA ligase [Candidatus Nomurabacteria bacterium]